MHTYIRGVRHTQSTFTTVLVLISSIAALLITVAAVSRTVSAQDTETSFTVAQIPDTQQEVLADNNPLMPDRFRWLLNNKQTLNLKFIAHSGDVVNWGAVDPVQFVRAGAAVSLLDNDTVPYALAIGNHDTAAVTTGGSAGPGNVRDNLRNTAAFNQTFPVSRFKNVAGAFEQGKSDNMYQRFSAGGADWIVITHEMWPRQVVLDWAKQIVVSNPNANIIINTHAYADQTGALPTTGTYGEKNAVDEWNQLISQYSNIKMVLSGHYGPNSTNGGYSYKEVTGVNGNKIAQIMTAYHSNYQNHVRLLTIDTLEKTIKSKIYVSTSTNTSYPTGYINDAASDFVTTGMDWKWPAGSTGPSTPTPAPITLPGTPTVVQATAGDKSASVSFTPPQSNGGSAITGYTVTSSPGNITTSGTTSPVQVMGLTNGVAYTFTVKATNSLGSGQPSQASNSVTPVAPVAELFPDPGFETGNGGWIPFTVGTFTRSSNPVRSGSSALTIAATSTSFATVGMTNNNIVTNSVAGRRYTASCYVRPSGFASNTTIRFMEYTPNYALGSITASAPSTGLPANTWSRITVTTTAQASGNRIIPQVFTTNQSTNTGTVTYDDCSYTATDPITVPGSPSNVSAVPGNGQAAVSFTAPASNGGSPITSYIVTSSPAGLTANGTTSPITVSGLTNGTAYTFSVSAVNAAGTGAASPTSAAVMPSAPVTAPDAPTNVIATPGDGQVSLVWRTPTSDGGSPITDYAVRYRLSSSSLWMMYDDGVSASTSATVSGLANGSSYDFSVSAINAAGVSGQSQLAAAVPVAPKAPDPVAPSAPQNVTATPGDGSATINFSPPASDGGAAVISYTVTTTPATSSFITTQSPLVISGLSNGTAYTFSVYATNDAGNSPAATSASATPAAPVIAPGQPRSLTAVAGNGSAVLSWQTPQTDGGSPLSGYRVSYRQAGSTIWISTPALPADQLTAEISNLTNGTTYEFVIAAANSAGVGQNSEVATTTPQAAPPSVPVAPDDLIAVAGDGQATVSFDSSDTAGGGTISEYVVTASPGGISASGSSSPITVRGLTNGISYTFTATARNNVGLSPASAASNSITPAAAPTIPGTPSDITAVSGNASATVRFTAPVSDGGSPITGYILRTNPGNAVTSTSASPVIITGLTNGTSYTFTVTAVNAQGNSLESSPSNSVVPISPAVAPGAPQSVNAVAGNGQVTLGWSVPASDGGAPITDYGVEYKRSDSSVWIVYNDGVSTATATTVNGLTNGVSYTFRMAARNSAGTGSPSTGVEATPHAPELLPDPGFESGDGGWKIFTVGSMAGVTSPVRSGTKAMKVTAASTSSASVGLTQNSVITSSEAGKNYTATCYVRPTSANLVVVLRFLEYTQNYSSNIKIGTTTTQPLPANTWTQVKVSATATTAGKRIIPQIYSSNQTTNTGYIVYDDCSMRAE